jgi:hypothetical protein
MLVAVGDLPFSIDITIKSNTGKKTLSLLASHRYKTVSVRLIAIKISLHQSYISVKVQFSISR